MHEYKDVGFEVKSTSSDGSTGSGLASVFFNIDAALEIVDDGSFHQDLPEFLENGFVGGLNHDWSNPIGSPTKAASGRDGLEVGWKLSPTAHGKDCMVLLKDRVIKFLSIGYQVLEDAILQTFDDCVAYWQTKGYTPSAQDLSRANRGGIRLLKRLRLLEFSPVTIPANGLAVISGVKAAVPRLEGNNVRDFERWLHEEVGLSHRNAKVYISQTKSVTGGYQHQSSAYQTDAERRAIKHAANAQKVKDDLARSRYEQYQEVLRRTDRLLAGIPPAPVKLTPAQENAERQYMNRVVADAKQTIAEVQQALYYHRRMNGRR